MVRRLQSVSLLLSSITAILVVMLVSIFAVSAKSALDRQREARHILSVVSIMRNMLSFKENIRVEGGVVRAALNTSAVASTDTRDHIIALHVKTEIALNSVVSELRTNPSIETFRFRSNSLVIRVSKPPARCARSRQR